MSRKALTPAAAGEIRRLYDEKDEWGEPRYSGAWIADQLGVSESTVWRVIRRQAAYAKVIAAPTQDQMTASMERTLALLESQPPNPETDQSTARLRQELQERKRLIDDPQARRDKLLEGLSEEVKERARGLL